MRLEKKSILVPSIWSLEVANAILVGERAKRIKPAETSRFLTLLENLALAGEHRSAAEDLRAILPLAAKHGLTAYDAAYLEVAIRRNAPLATMDAKLTRAARQEQVAIFPD